MKNFIIGFAISCIFIIAIIIFVIPTVIFCCGGSFWWLLLQFVMIGVFGGFLAVIYT